MATQTAKLGLTKPGLQDQALITVLNDNFDILDGLIDIFYPVGSIYMSVNSTDPGTIMAGTTWARLKDRFLVGAGDTYANEATGGSATHTLTVDEMPSHNHSFTGSAVTSGGISANHTHTGTSGNNSVGHTHSGPSHRHSFNGVPMIRGQGSSDANYICVGDYSQNARYTSYDGTGATGGISANHTHTTTTGNQNTGHTHSVTASGSIGNKGGGTAFSTLPPYLAVYMWKRTA